MPPSDESHRTASNMFADAESVLIQRSADDGVWEDVAWLPAGTTAMTDTTVLGDTSYAYRVQVMDEDGSLSDFTQTLAPVTSLPPLPQTPVIDSVEPLSAETLRIAWHSPTDDIVTGYRLERAENAAGPFTLVQQTTGETQAVDDIGLSSGTTHYYRLVAINGTGESNHSAVVSGATHQIGLPTPENVTATLMPSGQIVVNWGAGPADADAAVEYSGGTLAQYEPLATVNADASLSHHPVEADIYIYRVKFIREDVESEYAYTSAVELEFASSFSIYLPVILQSP